MVFWNLFLLPCIRNRCYLFLDPTSKAKAICKSKKLAYQRSIENAFSKVILIVLPNGKVTVEVDTTKPDLILTEKRLDEDKCLQVSSCNYYCRLN